MTCERRGKKEKEKKKTRENAEKGEREVSEILINKEVTAKKTRIKKMKNESS